MCMWIMARAEGEENAVFVDKCIVDGLKGFSN